MKKLALILIASCAFVQSLVGAESPLNSSLRPFKAIIDSPKIQNRVPQNSFIIGIERLTRETHQLGTVYYQLDVRFPKSNGTLAVKTTAGMDIELSQHSSHHHKFQHDGRIHSYLVTFEVTQNGIGPLNYKLVRLTPIADGEDDNSPSSSC